MKSTMDVVIIFKKAIIIYTVDSCPEYEFKALLHPALRQMQPNPICEKCMHRKCTKVVWGGFI